MTASEYIVISIAVAPLLGALLGYFGGRLIRAGYAINLFHEREIGAEWWARGFAHWFASASVGYSLLASLTVLRALVGGGDVINFNWFVWAEIGETEIAVGFLVDNLTALMMVVVTFVSLMVHIYTVGYMKDDDGYCRFFAYISLFTFAMLMLVMANNFMQLFFGWEAVGLVSYLLIGFWYKKPTAIFANLKAFLVNRVGDFGFLLGIGLALAVFGTLDYAEVFEAAEYEILAVTAVPESWHIPTVMCLLLFVGAMGKSAQFPLHVWLPDSMEGPTPISALIHAATMVTAGIFMVARMSPLFELSEVALTVVLHIGVFTAFFMGLLGLAQNDIKRVVAYSTLSQLGYMTAALGVSAYSAAVFHLFTHAFFKALLFLGAGSVIIALHHQQDMRRMGGLWRRMPITYITAVLGTLALIGAPPFSGFFSKDIIIEAAHESALPGAALAYWMLLAGAFVTALYSLRLVILVFHGAPRMDDPSHIHESAWVVTLPLVLLAIPSALAGGMLVEAMVFGDFFAGAITVGDAARDTVAAVSAHAQGSAWVMITHSISNPAFWAAMAGAALAVWLYLGYPQRTRLFAGGALHKALLNKYGIDDFNQWFWVGGIRKVGGALWRGVDDGIVDGFFVNGAAKVVRAFSFAARRLQSGAIYHYAFLMILAVVALILWRQWTA